MLTRLHKITSALILREANEAREAREGREARGAREARELRFLGREECGPKSETIIFRDDGHRRYGLGGDLAIDGRLLRSWEALFVYEFAGNIESTRERTVRT